MDHHPVNGSPNATRTTTIERFRFRMEIRKSERTADIYAGAVIRLDQWLTAIGDPRGFEDLDGDTIEEFLADFKRGRRGFTAHSDSYVSQTYRSLSAFYKWHADWADYPSPMGKVEPRKPGEPRFEDKVLSEAQIRAVMATVAHRRDFTCVRDHALLRLLLLGLRREEVVGLTEADINLREGRLRVVGKGDAAGSRTRSISFGKRTAEVLDDYLALRERHALAHERALWIGKRGVITGRGLHSIIRKRGEQAGVEGLYPHKFRHTAASVWLEDNGNEGHLMENMGWKTREMVDRYGKATRAQRAREEYRRRGLDDRF